MAMLYLLTFVQPPRLYADWGEGGQKISAHTNSSQGPSGPPPVGPTSHGCSAGDPVYLHSGEFYYQCEELIVPGRGMDLVLRHFYKSGMNHNGAFGFGWTFNYHERLVTAANGDVILVSDNFRRDEFEYDSIEDKYLSPSGYFDELVNNPDGTWTRHFRDGMKRHYDVDGKLTSIVDRNDNTISFQYDPAGLLPIMGVAARSENPTERIIVGYDYRLTQITDTVGRTYDFTYNTDGRLDYMTDYAGRVIDYTYDPVTDDLLTVTLPVTDQYPSGVTKNFAYINDHNLVSITDGRGQTFVTNRYDSSDRVYEQDLGEGTYHFDYSVAGQTSVTDRNGNETTYKFNAAGNPIEIKKLTRGLRAEDPESYITRYIYNNESLLRSIIQPNGNGVTYTYDSMGTEQQQGNLLEYRQKPDPLLSDDDVVDLITTFTYEPQFNFIKTMTDPKGNVTTYIYDYELDTGDPDYGTHGNLVRIEYPQVDAGIPMYRFSYNGYGQISQSVDPNGNVTTYDYEPTTGYLSEIIQDPAGINTVTSITWDSYGNIDTITDARGNVTDLDYDELGWLRQVTDSKGYVTQFNHDQNGNVLSLRRQAIASGEVWQTIQYTYDILNNIESITDPLGRVTTYDYDANENRISMLDAENNETTLVYDERDLLLAKTDANTPQGITQYDYDDNGNLKRVTDANQNETNYTYDVYNRLSAQTYADNSFHEYRYDKNSNLTQHRTPKSDTGVFNLTYEYDELNRLIASRFPLNANLDKTFIYDLGSRLTDANTAVAQNHFDYDALSRITSALQTLPIGSKLIGYDYDKVSNLTQIVYPSGKVLDMNYESRNLLNDVRVNNEVLSIFHYDPLGRRTVKEFLNASKQRSAYRYDLSNQLQSIQNYIFEPLPSGGGIKNPAEHYEQGEGAWLHRFNGIRNTINEIFNIWKVKPATADQARIDHLYSYQYDQVGNRLSMNAPNGEHNYTYNNIYELTNVSGVQTHSFNYDNVYNRTTVDGNVYTSNNLNQYESVNGVPYFYDGNGNLTDDGTRTFTYDDENRLITDHLSLSTYSYDAFNRRISKTVDGATTYFVYHDDSVIAEFNQSGVLNAEYVLGPNIDEVLTMTRGGEDYYYFYDGLGSVTEVTDEDGYVQEGYEYDVFGMPTIKDQNGDVILESAIDNPYMFTGRRWDAESATYYYRARQYDPAIGRFLQRDPIAYFDAMNLFQYTRNNPVNYTDPSGEIIIPIIVLTTLSYAFGFNIGLVFNVATGQQTGSQAWQTFKDNYGGFNPIGQLGSVLTVLSDPNSWDITNQSTNEGGVGNNRNNETMCAGGLLEYCNDDDPEPNSCPE